MHHLVVLIKHYVLIELMLEQDLSLVRVAPKGRIVIPRAGSERAHDAFRREP